MPTRSPRPARRHRRPRRLLALGVVGVGVAGALAVNAVAGASDAAGLRTATVRRSTVDQTLHDVGTVQPVDQAVITFPVAGTVASVAVAVGDAVTTGQALAGLDTAALQRAIDTAQAAVDQAELTLAKARAGELDAGSGSDGVRQVSLDSGDGSAPVVLASATQEVDADLAEAQDAVLDGQQLVDERLLAAQDALDSADAICTAVGDHEDPPAGEPTASTSTTLAGDDGTAEISACRDALGQVLTAQQAVADGQTALAQAAADLDRLLAQRAAESDQPQGSDDAPSDDAASDGSNGSTGASPSSADLIAYQKAVDEQEAKLAVAQQALRQASVVSPIDGQVVAVSMAVGDAVEAASGTARIVVVGAGGYEVTATVAVDQLPDVDLGQHATVRPDGSDRTLSGTVVAIGLAATSSSGTTYPVTIGLDDDSGLRNGAVAAVSIVTHASDDALVVPTSAVRATGGTHTVNVVDDGRVVAKDVQVGAIGPTWTEVTGGLVEGQRVVLADLDAPLPSSATSSQNGERNGGGNGPVLKFGFPGGANGGVRVG